MSIKVYPELPLLQKDLIDDGIGYYPNKINFDVVGFGNTVNNVRLDVCNIGAGEAAAVYVFPPAGGIRMSVVSSSANDTAAGTGVRTVRLHLLDANYNILTEDITLNGTTPVNTVATNILRINEMHTLTTGTLLAPAGDITLTSVGGATIYARMATSFNRSRNGVFTIPAGKRGYLTHWNAFSGTATGTHYTRFTLRATTHDNTLLPVFIAQDAKGTLNGGDDTYYDIPITLPEKTDIKVSVVSDSASANSLVNSHFSGWYE